MVKRIWVTAARKIWMKWCKSRIYNDTIMRNNKSGHLTVKLSEIARAEMKHKGIIIQYKNAFYLCIMVVVVLICAFICVCAIAFLFLWGPWLISVPEWELSGKWEHFGHFSFCENSYLGRQSLHPVFVLWIVIFAKSTPIIFYTSYFTEVCYTAMVVPNGFSPCPLCLYMPMHNLPWSRPVSVLHHITQCLSPENSFDQAVQQPDFVTCLLASFSQLYILPCIQTNKAKPTELNISGVINHEPVLLGSRSSLCSWHDIVPVWSWAN